MNSRFSFLTVVAASCVLVFAGCSSSPKSRISKNQAAFNTYPADVQTKIRAGEVAVGFTAEQVTLAMGKPDNVYKRTSSAGDSEVWVYKKSSPSLGFGLGFGTGVGSSSSVGTGVGVGTGGGEDERARVILTGGRVSAVEKMERK